ncbi:MAG: Glycerate 3-kinase [Bacteroidota bacterium]
MHILICPDKFRGSLTAQEACDALERGIKKRRPKSTIQKFPLADGGEGTLEVIQQAHGGTWISVDVQDPLFRKIQAEYLWLADQKMAYIEMSRASGLMLLTAKERNPGLTSSIGTGELILAAIEKGAEKIVLTLGGSATNDAGIGMAHALGYRFWDAKGKELKPIGNELCKVTQIVSSPLSEKLKSIEFFVITDVQNPLAGDSGAAHVFAKQKGATIILIKQLDKGLINIGNLLDGLAGYSISAQSGAGAAGGLGAGAVYFLRAKMSLGAEWVLDKLHIDRAIRKADYVITGEGKVDGQSWAGKLVSQVLQRADKQFKQTLIVCGAFEEAEKIPVFLDASDIFSVMARAENEQDAMTNAGPYLEKIGEEIALKYL